MMILVFKLLLRLWAVACGATARGVQLPWLDKAKQMVRKLWEEEYKPLPICPMPDEEPPLKRFRVMSALERHRAYRTSTLPGGTGSSQGSLLAGRDEYDHWLSHPDPKNDALVTDPVRYWWAEGPLPKVNAYGS